MGVAVSAVVVASVVASLTVKADERQFLERQQVMETNAVALGVATTYDPVSWHDTLGPVLAAVKRSGATVQIRDNEGRLVRTSPDFGAYPPDFEHRAPVIVNHRVVGSTVMRFGGPASEAILARYDRQRWMARIGGSSIGVLLALLVALLVAPRITGPLSRLLRTARAMGAGQRDARVGEVRGFRDLRELSGTFDQMAEALSRQDQLRRNLVADMAHQLRTPISVLQAGSEAMLDGVHGLTVSNVRSLRDETIRLGRMVDDLQQLSAAEAAAVQLSLTRTDLAAVAGAVADNLEDIFKRAGVTLVRRLTPAFVPCDEPRMVDIITNLLSNAAKFTPAGGCVVLETKPAGRAAILRVADTGIGIPAAELPHVSERFFRGASSAGRAGSGIGLAIVDELVRGHHGEMDISSKQGSAGQGGGTQVTITLPRS
ncbi:MAG TPA: HAMP domain-containing sensor histidine kinase [Streptosporangiaceae bacterium]|nr:HAMP domain-containing sensor histidine kinase [Streptosporangiaceae bacterium]